jgi:hypothetical protein
MTPTARTTSPPPPAPEDAFCYVDSENRAFHIGATSGVNRVFLKITPEGKLLLGPDVTWDEAASLLLDALERQIGRRITSVEPAPSATSATNTRGTP